MRKYRLLPVMVVAFVLMLSACSGNAAPRPPGSSSSAPTQNNQAVDCVWTLHVDQTIPVDTDGMTINYTLVLIAQKAGGQDVNGMYEGAAYLACQLDASNLSNEVFNVSGGFDVHAFANNLSFEVTDYNVQDYSDYGVSGGAAALAPLVQYESMALLTPDMQGSGVLNPSITGVQGEHGGINESVSDSTAVPMKITVNSGQAAVDIPSFNIDKSFKGSLTGIPVGQDNGYEEAKAKIEELIAQSEQGEAPNQDGESSDEKNDDSNDDLGELGGIIGDVGSNMSLPDSFPADDFPIVDGANIVNIYESDDQKDIRITYTSSMNYDDMLAFYQPLIEKMADNEYPVDDGVMFMGGIEGYRNVIFTIMHDPNNSEGLIVSIEVVMN